MEFWKCYLFLIKSRSGKVDFSFKGNFEKAIVLLNYTVLVVHLKMSSVNIIVTNLYIEHSPTPIILKILLQRVVTTTAT